MICGLMKNTYAALEYSFPRLCILTILQLLISIWPLWAVMLTGGATRLANLAIILIQGFFFIMASVYSGIDCKHVVWFPLTPYIRIYMTWKAVLTTIFSGGIVWRGTFYPLKELKEGR